jgi:hypothetical protein
VRAPAQDEFQPWPKIPRLYRDIVISEKIDGTNAAISIQPKSWLRNPGYGVWPNEEACEVELMGGDIVELTCQSRKRWITPGKKTDNFGFAAWVEKNKISLVCDLGCGLHFGEWWGSGIQRGYDLDEKRFSLFNLRKWGGKTFSTIGLSTVPKLYEGEFSSWIAGRVSAELMEQGSAAAPGYMNPEGIVVFFPAAGQPFKYTLDGDGHKG